MTAVARDGNSQHNFYFIRLDFRHPSPLLNVGKMYVFGKGTLGTLGTWQRNIMTYGYTE